MKWSNFTSSKVIEKMNENDIQVRWHTLITYSTAFDLLSQLSKPIKDYIQEGKEGYFYFNQFLLDLLNPTFRDSLTLRDVEILHALAYDICHGHYSKFINEVD